MSEGGTSRVGRVQRETAESSVLVEIDLDGSGRAEVDTGVPFYDHMLAQLGRHGGFDLTVRTKGDLEVDAHHTVEDTAIALGQAFAQALGKVLESRDSKRVTVTMAREQRSGARDGRSRGDVDRSSTGMAGQPSARRHADLRDRCRPGDRCRDPSDADPRDRRRCGEGRLGELEG